MPVMTDVRSVAANAAVENILQGKQHEFLSRPSFIHFAATGGGIDVLATMIVGNEIHVNQQEVNSKTAFPILPDDLVLTVPGLAGERITIGYRNTNAAARTVSSYIRTDPAA